MEMLVIAAVVLVAFAAVLVPLMRRRPDTSDAAEYGDASTHAPSIATGGTRAGTADEDDVGIAPMAAGPATPVVHTGDAVPATSPDEVELEIQRYRTAVRAGTVCRKCGQANPADSAFCFECGARLPGADVKEFE